MCNELFHVLMPRVSFAIFSLQAMTEATSLAKPSSLDCVCVCEGGSVHCADQSINPGNYIADIVYFNHVGTFSSPLVVLDFIVLMNSL